MNAPRRSDSIAEGVIVALVVVVLGLAATGVRLEPAPQVSSVDRLAAKVRMQLPIAPDCMRRDASGEACRERLAAARP
jgi:hypothetical protein